MMFIHNVFTISSNGKLTVLLVCHRTVSMAAVYQLKINCDQNTVSFPLEDKHVVNEHHVM